MNRQGWRGAGAVLLLSLLPAPQAPGVKVTETLMGPSVSGGVTARVAMSEDGDHIAIVAAKGSRQVVLLDGAEGPVFDEIPAQFLGIGTMGVVWSPTGGHSAYVGRRGGDFIAVIDGKESGVVATAQNQGSIGYGSLGSSFFWFNHDGSSLAYPVITAPGQLAIVLNGVAGTPWKQIDFRQTFLKGKRLAYVGMSADQSWHAVIDGKASAGLAQVTGMSLTPDGLHTAYLAVRNTAGKLSAFAVVDGVEGTAYTSVSDLEQAPDGRVAYYAGISSAGPNVDRDRNGQYFMVIGPYKAPNSTTFNLTSMNAAPGIGYVIHHVAWSPDGKRAAWIQGLRPNPGVQVMVDGKPMGPTYNAAGELQFSPDGSHFAYVGSAQTGNFLVMDGQELPDYGVIADFTWSPDGKRYAFSGRGQKYGFIVDGKELPAGYGVQKGSLRFSPDSRHVVYSAQATINSYQAYVDGVARPGILGEFAPLYRVQPAIAFPPIIYSPDATRLAYVGRKDAMSKQMLFVEGTAYDGPTQSFTLPAFSPDSRHFATLVSGGGGWTAMIDGKLTPFYQEIMATSLTASRFTDGRSYRFYAVKNGQIYRVVADLGA